MVYKPGYFKLSLLIPELGKMNKILWFVCICIIFTIINGKNIKIDSEEIEFANSRASDFEFVSIQLLHSSAPIKEIHFGYPGYPLEEKYLIEFENGTQWHLNLQLNVELVPDTFQFRSTGVDQEITSTDVEHCYYKGYLDESADSMAAMSTCDGLRGRIYYKGEFFVLHFTPNKSHFFYNIKDEHASEYTTCGTDSHENKESEIKIPNNFPASVSRLRRQSPISKFVELFIVIDSTLNSVIGGITESRQYAIDIANQMDMSYFTINVKVAIVGVTVWSGTDTIVVSGNLDTTLTNWLLYLPTLKLETTVTFDNAQLITGMANPSSNVVGMAPVGTMCFERSGAVNRDTTGSNAISIASTVSHEMGHNFGMQHDQGRACYQCTSSDGCIMNAVGGGNPATLFSTCSVDDLTSSLLEGVGFCIYNEPNRLVTDPYCGNGFVEEGEQCDCGTNATCESVDPCCEPGLCILKSGADCSAGECCVNCQFLGSEFLCRDNANICDLKEYCTGSDNMCPNNLYKRDGITCTTNLGNSYCYQGDCKVLTSQCHYLWGTTSSVASDQCFDRINLMGDETGNCGKDTNGNLVACTAENVKCGKVQCTNVDFEDFQLSGSVSLNSFTFTSNLVSYMCTSASIDAGNDIPDPGLIFDGTYCGIEQICISQQCVNISTLGITLCPKVNGTECAGNGVCTNQATCRCNDGFTGAICDNGSSSSSIVWVSFELLILALFLVFLLS